MPDVNLLRDTKQPDEPRPPERPRREFPLTDPSAQPAAGIGGFFRSMFSRRPTAVQPTVPPRSNGTTGRSGTMSLGRSGSPERILSETKKASRPAVIPLPED